MDALAFLAQPRGKIGSLYVLHGDEPFLKREAVKALRRCALGDDADDQSVTIVAGDKATFAEVFDELETMPFFETRRLVLVENGDPFVSRYRGELEKKIEHLPATGVLLLDVKLWQATTRLAKMVPPSATIVCKAPVTYKLPSWCSEWAKARHDKQLPAQAAALLVDLVGPEMGLLNQELGKLAAYVGARQRIDSADVDRIVGNSRAENTWKIFDAIGSGNVKAALALLQRLFDQGEEPMRMLGAFSMQLRRLAQAARLNAQGSSLEAALTQAGVPPFAVRGAEQQVRHLGRARLERLLDELLQLNMDLRGESPLSARTLFERFLVRLARPAALPRARAGAASAKR
jgi:DNA polymerase-3 subunit delta